MQPHTHTHTHTHSPVLPCSVLVVWSRYQTARHSFQTHWSSIRCLHPEDPSPSERLHISCLRKHTKVLQQDTQADSQTHNSHAATNLHQERGGPPLERHHRWPLKPPASSPRLQPHEQLLKKTSSIKVNKHGFKWEEAVPHFYLLFSLSLW